LDPAAAIIWHKVRAHSRTFLVPKRVRHFKNDAAHIFVSEKIVAGELQVVLRASTSQKKGSLRQRQRNESRLPL